jgi:hypothetical protein
MNGQDSNQPKIPDDGSVESMEFGDRLAHLKSGYDNSQSVVRFLDTKASAVIAAIPVVIAALTALFSVVKDWGNWEKAFASEHACALWTVITVTSIAIAALLLTAILAIVSAFKAITPRDTGKAKPSVLFPFETAYGSPTPDDSYAARVAFFKEQAKRPDVLEDYERQLVRMSQIVAQKLSCVNDAVGHLKQFFMAAVCLLGLICASSLLCAILAYSKGIKENSTSTPATTSQASTSRSS